MATRTLFSGSRNLLPHSQCHHSTPHLLSFFTSRLSSSQPDPNSSITEDVNELCRVLSDFREPHHDIESALHGFSGKISTHLVEQVLKRCRNLGDSAHRFFLWAAKLPGFRHSTESHHILVDILGSCNQFPLIWVFLSEIRDAGRDEIRPEIFWLLFRSYCKAKLPADAIRAFKKMRDFGLEPGVQDLHQLLHALCRNGLVHHAQEFFDSLKSDFSVNEKTYSILISGWAGVGGSTEALKLFEEMLERGCPVDVVAYNMLLGALCRGGDLDEAYKRFREMRKSHDLKPDASTYAVFIRTACEAKDVHSTLRELERMRRHNLVPNVFTYNCVIKLLCENEKVEEAYELLDEMLERGAKPDIWSYNAVLAVHCKLREVNRALRLLSRMDRDFCPPDRHTYNMVLKMLISVGRVDRAMEVWDGMEGRGFYPSVSSFAVMIHGLCRKKGRIEDACRYFETMVDEGIPPYLSTCEIVKDQLLQLGLRERLSILAGKMRRSTSCSIQELSNVMERTKRLDRAQEEGTERRL